MKKLLLSTIAIIAIALTGLQAQNSIWSFPPYFAKFNPGMQPPQPFPAPDFGQPTPVHYAGLPAEYSHNAMQDKDGNLLFFIVDGIIYDKNGYYMTTMDVWSGSGEILIVPDPTDCHLYHIFYDGIAHVNLTSHPFYFLLDMNNPTGSSSVSLANFPGIVNGGNSFVKNWYNQYAASQLRADGSRYVFINKYDMVHIFKIDASGLSLITTYANANPNFPSNYSSSNANRSEMEVIEVISPITGSPAYRLALSYPSSNVSLGIKSNTVLNADIDFSTGNVISGSEEFTEYTYYNNEEAHVHGLEFSQDGNLLYILHEPTTTYNAVIDIHTVGTGNNIFFPLTISNPSDYQFSQMELGKDNKLYVVGENPSTGTRLATLSNTNTPNPVNWNSNALAVGYNYVYSNYFGGVSNNLLKLYPLPDQIDGMDYTAHFTTDPECCIAYTSFDVEADKNNQEYTGTATWSAGATNNPFGSVSGIVTVRDKLVIKQGANITINSMTFEFAVGARLIVENGARLTINGTTLTVYSDCGGNALMWQGVEVWGIGTGTFQAAVSGKFIAQSYSVIEHAIEGAVNFNHAANPSYANNGGIIQATTGTKFRNNVKDVVFNAFQSVFNGNPYNDQSYFNDVTFITDASLNDPTYNNSITHASLNEVTGINFTGCDFENTDVAGTTYPYLNRGQGILTYNSKFTVNARCLTLTIPCTSFDESNFTNLTEGIVALNTVRTQVAFVNKSNFNNNFKSIYIFNMEAAKITENDFDIGASVSTNFSYGLYLNNCSGYIVENNNLTTTYGGYVGVYVNNSGTAANEIYRNNFSNLIVGSQAASTNGDNMGNGVGLEFRCNTYESIVDYDILISSGMVADDHGNCLTVTGPSNNQFSYTTQYGDFWAVTSSVGVPTYRYSPPNGYNLEPRNTYYNSSNTATHECVNLAAFNPSNSCPNRQGGGRTMLMMSTELTTQEAEYDSINNLMSTKDTSLLTILEEDMAVVKSQMQRTRSYIIQELLLNSKNSDGKLEVIDFLQQHAAYNTNADEQALAQLLIAIGNIGAAQSKIAQLQSKPNNGQFVEFSNIAITLKQHPKQNNTLLTDSVLLQQVKDLANHPNENSAVASARALLVNLGLATYEETIEVVIPTGSTARLANEEEETNTINKDSFVTVFPNPANDKLTISHNLTTKDGIISLEIMDVMGRVLMNKIINNTNNQIDINQLSSGLYFYNIIQNNKMVQSGKLVVE
ncbi:MAG: T9SS type A sorting domain-containing protein [Flavobacteriales bacterium]|nr:T9SS type A sorting domain-containing protein [Flavobacteriales bacterium]